MTWPWPDNPLDVLSAASAFVLVVSLWLAILVLWSMRHQRQRQQLEARLGIDVGDNGTRELALWRDHQRTAIQVPDGHTRRSLMQQLADRFLEAGFQRPARQILLFLVSAIVAVVCAAFLITLRFFAGFTAGLAVAIVFWAYLQHRIRQRRQKFDKQFLDALNLASRSLRAGHPLTAAFRLISQEIAAPVGPIFAEIDQQQNLGTALEVAMRNTAERWNSQDLRLFATSIVIQLRSGGNMADMMERLGAVIRQRMRLMRRVQVLTAQTQFSKNALIALPLILFVVLNLLNPSYMGTLYNTHPGRIVMAVAVAGLVLGTFIINRMAVLRY